MRDLHFRGTSLQALVKAGRALGFILPDTGEGVKYAPGVDVDVIRNLVLVPGVYDENGNEVTPPVLSSFIHANVRLSRIAESNDERAGTDPDGFDTSKMRKWVRDNGVLTQIASARRQGVTHEWYRHEFPGGDIVELIWPAPEFPRRVWL